MKKAFEKNKNILEHEQKIFKLSLLKKGIDEIREYCIQANDDNKILRKEENESLNDYYYRIYYNTDLLNATEKAINSIVTKTFEKKVVLNNLPEKLNFLENDCDLLNTSITSFSSKFMKNGLWCAKSYVFIDYNKEEDKAYFVNLENYQILDIRYDDKMNITSARILVFKEEEVDEFETKTVKYVYHYKKINENKNIILNIYKDKIEEIFEQKELTIDEIPLVEYYPETTVKGLLPDVPFLNLADKNFVHFRSMNDQRNILHYNRVPFLFLSGFDEKEAVVKLGANYATHSSNPESDVKWIESTGSSVDSGWKDIEKLEKQLEAMGAEMLVESDVSQTATEVVIKNAESRTRAASMARNLQDSLNICLYYVKKWMNIKDENNEITATVNTNVKLTLDNVEFSLLIQMHTNGVISSKTLREQANLRGIFGDNFDEIEELGRLEDEGSLNGKLDSLFVNNELYSNLDDNKDDDKENT